MEDPEGGGGAEARLSRALDVAMRSLDQGTDDSFLSLHELKRLTYNMDTPSSAELALARYCPPSGLSSSNQELRWSLTEDLMHLKSTYSTTIDVQQEEISRLRLETESLTSRLRQAEDHLDQALADRQRDNDQHKQVIAKLQEEQRKMKQDALRQQEQMKKLDAKLSRSEDQRGDLEAMLSHHKKQSEVREAQLGSEMSCLRQEYAEATKRHLDEVTQLKVTHSDQLCSELGALKRKMEEEREEALGKQAKAFAACKAQMDKDMEELNGKIATITGDSQRREEKLRSEADRELHVAVDRERARAQSELQEQKRAGEQRLLQEADAWGRKLRMVSEDSEAQKQRLEREVEDVRAEVRRARQETRDARAEGEQRLQECKSRMREEADAAVEQCRAAMASKFGDERAELQAAKSSLQADLSASEDKVKQLVDKFSSLEKQLARLEEERVEEKRLGREERCALAEEKDAAQFRLHQLQCRYDSTEHQRRNLEHLYEREKVASEECNEKLRAREEQSQLRLRQMTSKFANIEKSIEKLEKKVVHSLEKTSAQLLRALVIPDGREAAAATSVASALDHLRWVAKETIQTVATNQATVLDVVDKWKRFEAEKSEEVEALRRQFETETKELIHFSKREINQLSQHHLSQFNTRFNSHN